MSTAPLDFNEATFGLPVESYRVDAYVTDDERLPVVTEYVLRLLRVCGDTTLIAMRDYFGFSDAEALAVVESLNRQGLVTLQDDELSLSAYASERFDESSSEDYPRFTKVELRRDTVTFDLLSFSPLDSRDIGVLNSSSIELTATAEALGNSLKQAETAYYHAFAAVQRLKGGTDGTQLNLYSVEEITSKKRGFLAVPVTFSLGEDEQPERTLSHSLDENDAPELFSLFHEEVSSVTSAKLSLSNNQIERFLDEFDIPWMRQYVTGKKFALHRFAVEVRDGRVVTPEGVSPVFGNLYLPENLSLLAERIDRLRSDRSRRLHTSAAWLAPDNNLWGRGSAMAEAFDKLNNSLQLFSRSEMSVFWPTKVGEEKVVAKRLASLTGAKHHAYRPPVTRDSTFGGRLELFLYPTGFAVALFHISLPNNHGLLAPVGFVSTRESDIEHVHQLLLQAAGSGAYGGRITQSMRREDPQPFEKACGFLNYSDWRPRRPNEPACRTAPAS